MNVKKTPWYPVMYMFVATLCFSAVLLVFGNFTRDRVKNNEQIAFERSVLQALSVTIPERISPADLHRLFTDTVHPADESSAGALRYMRGDSIAAYALPIQGPGFWAPIKGVIGIAADKRTITGISFYEQNETPGLGGEIVKQEFRDQFVGKTLSNDAKPLEIRMTNTVLDEHSVHAITGATQTSNRLGEFMNQHLKHWIENMTGER
jgi:Na+-transporting NADH:ubiquinone oxidoreductase subunit C